MTSVKVLKSCEDSKENFSGPVYDNCLVKVDREEWPKIRDLFKSHWPYGIYAYHVIQNYINWTSQDPTIDCNVYCPCDSINTGTVVIETVEKTSSTVYVFTLEKSCEALFRSLAGSSNVIGWWRGPLLFAIHEDHWPHVHKALQLIGVHIEQNFGSGYHWVPKEQANRFDITCPDEVYIRNIRIKDIPYIDSRWPHRYPGSVDFLTQTITRNGGLGLYLKEGDQIVAWILRNQHNGIGVLQTIEEYRRRGFAGLLVKAMSRKMVKECGIDVHTCIVRENHASLKLFKTLGFQHIGNIRFVKLKYLAE